MMSPFLRTPRSATPPADGGITSESVPASAPAAEATAADGPVALRSGAVPVARPGGRTADGPPPDLVWQLWFEQFRQLAWMAVTAAGGTLLLDESDYLRDDPKVGLAVFLFALSAGVAFIGQDNLVDHLTAGRSIERGVKMARLISVMLLSVGAGVLLAIVFR